MGKLLTANKSNSAIAHGISNSIVTLEAEDIYYFEYQLKRVYINSIQGQYIASYSLKELLEKFHKYDFGLPHKSFVINMLHVKLIKGFDIFMDNDVIIPLAQKRAAEFRIEYNNFLQSTYHRV